MLRQPVFAHAAGARGATHSGTIRGGLRSAALGTEAGGARWKERKEASDCCDCDKAGGVAASPVGERRSVRTVAQQQSSDSDGSRVEQNRKPTSKSCPGREETKAQSRVGGPIRWQHRLKRERPTCTERPIAPRECGWKHGHSGDSAEEQPLFKRKNKNSLDFDRPSHGRRLHSKPVPGSMSDIGMFRQLTR
jgi:hypothetical protein